MFAKQLFEQYRETAPLTTGQNSRLFEQSLRVVAIPTPTVKQSDSSQKTAQITNADLSQFFEPKQAAQIDPLHLLERQKAIQAAKKRQPKGKIILHNDPPPNSGNMADGMIF